MRTGGRHRPDLGPFFYEPTILEGVTPDMTCFGQETFGPVVSVYRFHDEADAISRANEGQYGLNASIWSRDTKRARAVARQILCGSVNVNEAFGASFGSVDSPMGGFRQSGLGRRQGGEGVLRFTESQSVAVQKVIRLAPMLGMSDESVRQADDRQPAAAEEDRSRMSRRSTVSTTTSWSSAPASAGRSARSG